MKTIDVQPDVAEDALVRLARQVPADVAIGRPMLARPGEDPGVVIILTTEALWWVNSASADRLDQIGGDLWELTEFCGGMERSRTIAHAE